MDTPITKQEMLEVLHYFFDPIFQFIGGALAFIVIAAAVILVIKPFIRRI